MALISCLICYNSFFTTDACQQRWHRGIRPDLIKGKWTKEEDHLLIELVSCGCSNWGVIAAAMESRTPKQCRERWTNYLDPTVNHEKFTAAEDTQLIALQNIHGNRWAEIARCLPGRTETAVKLRFNSLFRQRERIEQEQKIREQITLAQGGGAVYGRQPQALQEESGEEQWNDHQSCDDQQSSNKRQRRS